MAKRSHQSKRFDIFKRDGFACVYCGSKAPDAELQVDHITPHARGGSDHVVNLVTSCRRCNMEKRAEHLSDDQWWALVLRNEQLAGLEETFTPAYMFGEGWESSLRLALREALAEGDRPEAERLREAVEAAAMRRRGEAAT